MERTAECHCGQLKVIALGESERVYLCHCRSCQRRTGTAFHFGASYPKDRVRLEGESKVYERGADSGDITGDLTMHGVSRAITLHVKLASPITGESLPARTRWQVTTDPIHRKDFNLLFSGGAEAISGISQDVAPAIEIEAVRAE